jgi:hypothetical protein
MSILSRTLLGANFMTVSSIRASWRVSLAILFLTWGMHAMAAPNDKPVITASNVVVTLDVFSGRPNPTWSLSEGMAVEFLRRLHALDGAKAAPREFEDLGYRAVSAEFQDETKGTVAVKVSRGVVTLDRAGQRVHFLDTGRQFELWLVNTGAVHLTADILRYVTGEIAKPQ